MSTDATKIPMVQLDANDTVIIELDRPRELKLGHKALKRFSALTGCSIQEMEREVSHYDKMACLMYVMLAVDAEAHGETLSPDQVDDLLEQVPIYQQLELVGKVVNAAFDPGSEEDEEAHDPLTAAGTGEKA